MGKIITIISFLLLPFFIKAEPIELNSDGIINIQVSPNPCNPPVINVQPSPVNAMPCLNFLPQLLVETTGATSFQWYKDGIAVDGATQSVYSFNSSDDSTNIFTVDVINSCATVTSESTKSSGLLYVFPSMLINASQTEVGIGQPITFTAEQLMYGGTAPEYQWRVNDSFIQGATNDTFVLESPVDNDRVYCVVKTNHPCAFPSEIMVGPIEITVFSSIGAGIIGTDQIVCHTNIPNTIIETARVTGLSSNTKYTWQISPNGIDSWSDIPEGTEINYTPQAAILTNAYYRRVVKDDSYPELANIAISNIVTIMVTFPVTPSVTITAFGVNKELCDAINLTANVTNAGQEPSYRWMKNGITIDWIENFPVLIENDYSDGDIFTCEITSSSSCTTLSKIVSEPITIHISPYPVALTSILTPGTPTEGQEIILKAMPSEESTYSFAYTWYRNGTEITNQSDLLNTIYKSGDIYSVKMVVSYLWCTESYTSISDPLILGSSFSTMITGPSSVNPTQTNVVYSVPLRSGIIYKWSVPSSATIASGQGTNSIVVNFGISSGQALQRTALASAITVTETNTALEKSTISLELSVVTGTKESQLAAEINVYPVPSVNELHIQYSGNEKLSYVLYDSQGAELKRGIVDTNPIEIQSLSCGIYNLLIQTNDIAVSKRIIKK